MCFQELLVKVVLSESDVNVYLIVASLTTGMQTLQLSAER